MSVVSWEAPMEESANMNVEVKVGVPFHSPYLLENIEISLLVVEHYEGGGFQRPQNPKWCTELKNNFDPRCLEPIIVAEIHDIPALAGRFSLVEGQNRVAVLEDLGYTTVPALVYQDILDAPERAALYQTVNTKKKTLTIVDSFRALGQARNTEFLQMLALCAENDFYIEGHHHEYPHTKIRLTARTVIRSEFVRNSTTLNTALSVLNVWPVLPKDRDQKHLIKALCELARHARFDPDRMRNKLEGVPVHELIYEAKEDAAKRSRPIDTKAVRYALTRRHDSRLSHEKRIAGER